MLHNTLLAQMVNDVRLRLRDELRAYLAPKRQISILNIKQDQTIRVLRSRYLRFRVLPNENALRFETIWLLVVGCFFASLFFSAGEHICSLMFAFVEEKNKEPVDTLNVSADCATQRFSVWFFSSFFFLASISEKIFARVAAA